MALKLKHAGYSKMVGDDAGKYEGRSRITSMSDKINGGVYCPPGFESEMEATVVDYQKDPQLLSYLQEMGRYIYELSHNLSKAGRKMTFEEVIQTMCHKIAADFPYAYRMLDKTYQRSKYRPGQKIYLGVMMNNQDLVCRHMGLLMGVTIDYFKELYLKNEMGFLKFKPDTEIRFMGDRQHELEGEKIHSGHAYLVLRKPKNGGTGNDIFVADPTNGQVMEIGRMVVGKNPKGHAYYRYMFSAMRFMLQSKNNGDLPLLDTVFSAARYDVALLQVLKDVKLSLRTAEAIRNYTAVMTRLNMKGLL